MQTFLPCPTFRESARVLDRARLGKQRVEVYQILRALLEIGTGWSNHPAVRMWRGHERALALYGVTVCAEWMRRGYKDTVYGKILELLPQIDPKQNTQMPAHFDEVFRRSHQSNLLRKDPEHYGPHFPGVPHDLPYVWPVSTTNEVTNGT